MDPSSPSNIKSKSVVKHDISEFKKGIKVSYTSKGNVYIGIVTDIDKSNNKVTVKRGKRGKRYKVPLKRLTILDDCNIKSSESDKPVNYDIKGRNVLDFIQTDIKNFSKVSDILGQFSSTEDIEQTVGIDIRLRSARGFVYERIWDLCIKFGVVDLLTLPVENGKLQTSHVFGNSNIENIVFTDKCWSGNKLKGDLLSEKIQSGNTGGYSDITFLNKKQKENDEGIEDLYLISVKYYEHSKSIDKYDIGKLCTLVEKHQNKNRNINILIFVKDKKDLILKFKKQHRSSDIMMKYINPGGQYENIYDEKDLEEYYYKLKKLLELYDYFKTPQNIDNFDKDYLYNLKSPFIPRFHQKLFIDKIGFLLDERNKNILVGAVPRSGKSYIMAGSILEIVKNNKSAKRFNFLLITPAPNETFGEYNDIFNNYIDFDNNNIQIITLDKAGKKVKPIGGKHVVYIVSKQLLGWGGVKNEDDDIHEEQKKKLPEFKNIDKHLKGIDFDLIYLDEAHFGMSTDRSQSILNSIEKEFKKSTPKIFVTATYNKPLKVFGVTEECKLTWDINDIDVMKSNTTNMKDNPIRNRFGHKIYDDAIIYFNNDIEKIKHSYSYYPKPYLMTSIWDYNYLHREKDKLDDSNYGFDMKKVFANDAGSGKFKNESQIKNMFHYFFGFPDKSLKYSDQHIYRQRGIIPRIKKICGNNCRTMQSPLHKTSQLWFLPYGMGMKIADTVTCLVNLFSKDSNFKDIINDYHFYIAVEIKDKNYDNMNFTSMKDPHNIKDEIKTLEGELNEGKKNGNNLIILAGARLQLGISLSNVDIVVLWNTIMSSDANFQMLFRSMTEVKGLPPCESNAYCNEKKFGFMVDLNPQRALTNVLLFGENLTSKKSEGNKFELISDLVNIDEDVFHDKYKSDSDSDRSKFVKSLFDKLYSSWDKGVDDIRMLTSKTIKYDEEILKQIEKSLRQIKLPNKSFKDIIDKRDDSEVFDPGNKAEKKDKKESNKTTKKEQDVKDIPLKELASELLSEFISLLNIFSLYVKGSDIQCILTDNLDKEELEDRIDKDTITIINDINELKTSIFKNEGEKSIFLQILNGRLGGDNSDELPDKIIDVLMESITTNPSNLLSINNVIMAQKKKYYTIKEPDKLLEYINDNLTPKEKEKKEAGEVFTPISIVEEMLDKLPPHVWSDHTLKWLDPAVGIGNFPICVYLRLMDGLKSWEHNEEKRRKHIIENMLYMVEISKKSITILNKVFCSDKYKLNIGKDTNKTISFLDDTYDLNDFDIIMANPPYNEGGVGKGGGVFWKGFVEKSLRILNDNGYLVMIHPTGWRKPKGERASGGDIWDSFKPYHLEALKISDVKIPHFPRVDYYVLNKSNKTSNTRVINEFQSIKTDTQTKLKGLPFIPHLINDDVVSILDKLFNKKGEKFNIIRNQSFKPGKADEKKYGRPHAFFYDGSKNEYVEVFKTYTDKDKNTEYISKPKIIMTYTNGKKPAFLYPKYFSKEMGGTANTMYHLTTKSDSVNNLMKFLESQLIHFLLKITQFSEAPNHKNEFKILNMITKPNEGNLKSDADIYNYYGITKEGQKLIEQVVNHVKPTKVQNEPKKSPPVTPPKEPVDQEPEPEKPELSKNPKKPKTIKKGSCSPAHPPGPPCKTGFYPKSPKNCCYKNKTVQNEPKKSPPVTSPKEPVDQEPEPEPEEPELPKKPVVELSKKSKKPKTIKKGPCSPAHPSEPCKDGLHPKPPKNCCYKKKTVKKGSKKFRKKRRKTRRKKK